MLLRMTRSSPSRIYAGPRTWALVREAYLSGETAQAVCARFGVNNDALRAQATRNGWTKRAYADSLVETLPRRRTTRRASAPGPSAAVADSSAAPPEALTPVDAGALAHTAVAQAASALKDGRFADAGAQLKLAESLAKLAAALPPPPERLTPEEQAAARLAEEEIYARDVWGAACRLAKALLTDGRGVAAVYVRNAFAWRKEHLGEEAAEGDRAQAERGGWAARVYDENGVIRPPESFEDFSRKLSGRGP